MSDRLHESIRSHPYAVLFGPWSVGVAAVVVVGALAGGLLSEPGRFGLDLCWMRRLSGLPCPGCGLTRSVCHLVRGELADTLRLHPFGLLVLPFSLVAASSPFWPEAFASRVRRTFDRRRRGIESAYRGILFAFLAYGVVRSLAVLAGLWPAWA